MPEHRSTARVLEILLLVADSKNGYTLTQIAEALDAPKSSLFPIVQTMRKKHFLHYNSSTMCYRVGSAAFRVGMQYVNRTNGLSMVGGEMDRIVEECEETCFFAILDDGKVIYLQKKDSPKAIRMIANVGVVLPAYGTGIGKALLMDHSAEELRETYPNGLAPLTPNTITDINTLHRQLVSFRRDDVAYEFEESNTDIRCCATPIRKDGKILAAMSVAVPIYRCDDERMRVIRDVLLAHKKRLEALFSEIEVSFASS